MSDQDLWNARYKRRGGNAPRGRRRDDKETLADALMAATYDARRMMRTDDKAKHWYTDEAQRELLALRAKMLKARRFVLDAQATRYVVDQSIMKPSGIMEVLRHARPPFDYTWIEDNLQTRMERGVEVGLVHQDKWRPDERSGFLIERVTDTKFRAHVVYSVPPSPFDTHVGDVMLPGVSMLWDTERMGNVRHQRHPGMTALIAEVDAYVRKASPALAALVGDAAPDDLIWGRIRIPAMDMARPQARAETHAMEDIYRSAAWDMGVLGYDGVVAELVSGKITPERRDLARQAFGSTIVNMMGDLRYLVTVLATIGVVETRLLDVEDKGDRMVGTRRVPYLSHRVVSIKVPVKSVVRACRRATGIKKRAHEVRGHWRKVREGEGFRETWIKAHQRGDASLGFVRKEYEVTKG